MLTKDIPISSITNDVELFNTITLGIANVEE